MNIPMKIELNLFFFPLHLIMRSIFFLLQDYYFDLKFKTKKLALGFSIGMHSICNIFFGLYENYTKAYLNFCHNVQPYKIPVKAHMGFVVVNFVLKFATLTYNCPSLNIFQYLPHYLTKRIIFCVNVMQTRGL